MSLRSGLAGQIGIADETTYGTRVAPTAFFELGEEDLSLDIQQLEAFGMRASAGGAAGTVQRTDRIAQGRKGAAGTVGWSPGGDAPQGFSYVGMEKLIKHVMGQAPTITTPGGGTLTRNHEFQLGDPFALPSFTCQVGRPDVSGTVRVHEFEGCMITAAEWSQGLDEWLGFTVDVDAEDETTSQTLATASYLSGYELAHWGQLTVLIAGGAVDAIGFNLRLETPLKTDRYFVRASTLKKQPILAGRRMITGSVELEYGALTEYNRYTANTIASVQGQWVGSLIEGALNKRLTLLCNDARWGKPEGPNVRGPDLLTITCPFEALYDGTDPPLQVDIRTTQTAA